MKKLTTIFLLMFAGSVFAGEAINKTMDADPNGTVSVSNISGSVTVEGWTRDQVEVTQRRLQVDTILKLLAKWNPKKYGDRQAVAHEGGVTLTVNTGVPRRAE